MNDDELWMRRCLLLARKGEAAVSPNPLVGAVIVENGRLVAEGFHERYGAPHAEINAFARAARAGVSLEHCSLYVNLEPCYHEGLTPPCVDEIIRRGIRRVVIAVKDPNPLVAGKSIRKLRQAGIECTLGVLKDEATHLNERFFGFITTRRPFVALKAAQTADGFIAREDGRSRWISSKESRTIVHHLRNIYDAIVVGAATVIADDPELTVRHVKGRNPLRILIDGSLRTPVKRKIFNAAAATVIYTAESPRPDRRRKAEQLERMGVAVQMLPSKNGILKIPAILRDLKEHSIASVLVEGGQRTYLSFLYSQSVDKVFLFTAQKKFGAGLPTFGDFAIRDRAMVTSKRRIGPDILEELYLH